MEDDGLARSGLVDEESARGLVISELERGVGLAIGTGFLGDEPERGGRGAILGCVRPVMGPTITPAGTGFGAGAGM